MEDTHEFFSLLKTHGLGRTQALRLIGTEFATPITATAAESILRGAAADALPIMVFVANPGMIQIHTGPVSKIAPHGEWINVLDDEFNLHLRQPALTHAWAVRKPTKNGHVTSVANSSDARARTHRAILRQTETRRSRNFPSGAPLVGHLSRIDASQNC